MKSIIQSIILDPNNNIKVGYCFDSHLIIELIIEQYSDDYFKFISKSIKPNSTNIANMGHGQLSMEIKKLSEDVDPIIEKCVCKSVSFTIHNKLSECALWKRIK